MNKKKLISSILILTIVSLILCYQGCRIKGSQKTEIANNVFDPNERMLKGSFSFSLDSKSRIIGKLDYENIERIKNS